MKLLLCRNCWTLTTISDYDTPCRCWQSIGKRLQGTKVVQVYGPCDVYVTQDKDVRTGKGKLWRLEEPHGEIRRLKDRSKNTRVEDAKKFQRKRVRDSKSVLKSVRPGFVARRKGLR